MKATELQLGNINKRKKKKMTKLIAKNLMVGDYVLYPATNIIFKVQTISGGEQDTLHYVTAKNRIGDFLSRSEWEGVPLTHEILEKNGVDHIWYEVTGADHDNNVIKSGLYNLFKQIANDKAGR